MAALTTYDTYKPSGIDWIGDIPCHWKAVALKHLVGIRITDGPHETPEFIEDGVPFVSAEAVKNGKVDFNFKRGCISPELDAIYSAKSKPKRGDIFIVKSGSTTGKVAYVDFDDNFNIWSPLALIRSKPEHNSFFLYRALASEYFQKTIQLFWSYGTQPNIGMNVLENLRVVVPPLSEQAAIARYLDEKTAQLDTLIDRKRRLIDLLREEKTALINEAVTKGINPDVPMKDSGIEWLGEIPAHWEVKKLKHVANVRSGFALNGGMGGDKGIKLPYLRVANVQDGYLRLNDVAVVEIDSIVAKRYYLHKGDLLMNEGGDNDKLGRGCVWRGEIEPCLHQNHVFAVRMKEGVNTDWINLLTMTTYARQYFFLNCKQSTNLASISQTNIKELSVLMPPDHEQNEILKYLGTETAKIDHAISRIEREIELMQEYRTALISEVVTGKVKVI